MKDNIKRLTIRDRDNNIVSILYLEDGLSYRVVYTISREHIMEVELLLNGYYIGSIECWKGSVQEVEMVRDENGWLVEKEV